MGGTPDDRSDAALPVFVNGVGGLGSPWWIPALASRFVGDAAPLLRFAAVVESVAFLVAANHRAMTRGAAAPARVYATGGLSRSDFLCERLAAVLGAPVRRLPAEATARGVAALAAPDIASAWDPGRVVNSSHAHSRDSMRAKRASSR